MKRFILSLFALAPALLSGQIDQLRPAMQLDEVRAKFPDLVRDYGSMTSWASGDGKQLNVEGRATYLIQCDTVVKYQFESYAAYGPSEDFPTADSAEVMKLISAARTLVGHFTDLYGNPAEYRNQSLVAPGGVKHEVEVIYSRWKNATDEILVRVYRAGKSNFPQINAAPKNEKEVISTPYLLELITSGKSLRMRTEFGMGMTAAQFRKWQPDLASQVVDHPDCWMRNDTSGGINTHWRFQFREEKLIGYFYDAYAGVDYGETTEIAYATMLARAQKLKEEATKQFGNPYKDSTNVSKKYSAPKKPGLYYSRVDYLAQWKPGSDFLMIRLNERGGGKQGPPVFHLEVYFGKRD